MTAASGKTRTTASVGVPMVSVYNRNVPVVSSSAEETTSIPAMDVIGSMTMDAIAAVQVGHA